ncbi:MAG TPA: hypothetical protein DCF33_00240, partial [Saprospirales bacterium]|nr:hypothetical protein [Saprospirales bacterium]
GVYGVYGGLWVYGGVIFRDGLPQLKKRQSLYATTALIKTRFIVSKVIRNIIFATSVWDFHGKPG